MPGFIDNVVEILKKHPDISEKKKPSHKSSLDDKEKYAVAFSFSQMEATLESGVGELGRVFDGFAEVQFLAETVEAKQKQWEKRYIEIISKIKDSELDKNGALKANSVSAKRLENLYIEIMNSAFEETTQPNGEVKNEIYQALKIDNFRKKAEKAYAEFLVTDPTSDEVVTKRQRVEDLSDKRKISGAIASAYFLYPLSTFAIKVENEAIRTMDHEDIRIRRMQAARMYMMFTLNQNSDMRQDMMEKWLIKKLPAGEEKRTLIRIRSMHDRIQKQLNKLEKDKTMTKDPDLLEGIESKTSYLQSAMVFLQQYKQKQISGLEFLIALRDLDHELRAATEYKSKYKKIFHIAPSATARLLTSLCKELEKNDPECRAALAKKGKKESDPGPRLIL